MRLLVPEQDPNRLEAKELREERPHVFEQFREGALGADQGRELDAHDHLLLGYLTLVLRFQLVKLELDEGHYEDKQLILYWLQMLPMRFICSLALGGFLALIFILFLSSFLAELDLNGCH